MRCDTLLLEAQDIARRRPEGRGWLLKRVSLEIRAGTRLSVAGSSGSGKTLLLRALALLDPLDHGQIRWKGRPVARNEIPDFRRAAIYLHQRPALLEEKVEAALRRPFSLSAHRRRRFDKDRILELLGQLGRDESLLAKAAGDLSGGEIQIVALLRVLQLDPTMLLLDEPTAALDPQTTAAVEGLVQRWVEDSSERRAMVWVTHDAAQARRVAERTLHMQDGRMRDEGHTS